MNTDTAILMLLAELRAQIAERDARITDLESQLARVATEG